MPYILVGGTKFYERAEIKDALAYLRLANNPSDDVSFRRVVNVPARGVGTATLEAVEAAASERGVSLLAVLDAPREGLTERAKKALAEFRDLVAKLRDFGAAEGCGAGAAVAFALEETGLLKLYESSLDPQDEARRENLDELLAAAREHERATSFGGEGDDPSVAGFLDAVTLRADADEADEKKGILLITLHAAKGLEFDEVFLAGFEEGSLPHASSRDDDEQFEEERRLAYVGMTRAKDRLTLSYFLRRMVRGEWMSREPSPFLSAIPESVLEREDLTSGFGRGRTGGFLESGERGGARERGFGSDQQAVAVPFRDPGVGARAGRPDFWFRKRKNGGFLRKWRERRRARAGLRPGTRLRPRRVAVSRLRERVPRAIRFPLFLFAFSGAQPVAHKARHEAHAAAAHGIRVPARLEGAPSGVRPGRRPDDRRLRRRREADRLLRPRGPQEVRGSLCEPLAGLRVRRESPSRASPRPAAACGDGRRGARSPTRGGRPSRGGLR